ncbi:hypothetical protein KUCAC02_026715 [Chaenocephalus aceratus]|nr:hypothetical protein KUCAC02_026715 [Chaenocephalus aceratus]
MEAATNRRGSHYHFVQKKHLKLKKLRVKMTAQGYLHKYLFKNDRIPEYPRPEIHVSCLKHDTDRKGLKGIKESGGFRDPWRGDPRPKKKVDKGKDLVWWGLVVGGEEVRSAEQHLLQETEQQVQDQQSFLGEFASSPAFKKSSRLGSYRFTFPLQELLEAYKKQFCGGEQPVMRVYETHLYKQEVMYAVLVHSPANQKQFSEHPLLTDDPNAVCCYRDNCFTWRPEAMCGTHSYQLVQNPETQQMEARPYTPRRSGWGPEFYVWDNVGIALHVEDKLLEFGPDRLREELKFCEGEILPHVPVQFDDFPLAEATVQDLWPDDRPLQSDEDPSSLQSDEDPSPLDRDEEQGIAEAE